MASSSFFPKKTIETDHKSEEKLTDQLLQLQQELKALGLFYFEDFGYVLGMAAELIVDMSLKSLVKIQNLINIAKKYSVMTEFKVEEDKHKLFSTLIKQVEETFVKYQKYLLSMHQPEGNIFNFLLNRSIGKFSPSPNLESLDKTHVLVFKEIESVKTNRVQNLSVPI